MYYFYKRLYSALSTFKLTGCNATSFPGLEKHADDIKDYGKRMDAMCFIKIDDPQRLSQLWNYIYNGTILQESTDMYLKTISKAFYVLCKYKTPDISSVFLVTAAT